MSRIGGATAPVKCEEKRRTLVEIKQEQCGHDDTYGESHADYRADSSVGKPPSSSLSTLEAENSYEFLGNMKCEADEPTNSTTPEPPSKKKGDICPLCQQVYNTRPYYGDYKKRAFAAHLVKVHDYNHLRGYCIRIQCKYCKIKRDRCTFIVGEGNNYKFSDMCDRCQERTCPRIRDHTDGLQHPINHHQQSVAHQEWNTELQECLEGTAETPTTAEGVQPDKETDLVMIEELSTKKRDVGACHLCQKVYYKKTYNGSSKRDFVSHLVKAHHYRHLRGHTLLTKCKSCNLEKGRWSFVVSHGDNYKFSDECSACQRNRRSGAWMASQWKNFVAHQESSAEHRERPEATIETPSASEETPTNEAHFVPQQYG